TGYGETICVIDSGVDFNHTNLGGGWGNKVIEGYNAITDQECSDNPLACIDDTASSHGTHVAGIIISNHSQYRGVAPDANIVVVKVLDSLGEGETSDVIQGIEWCVNNASYFNISVITMSLGEDSHYNSYCDDNYPLIASAINSAFNAGITVIVAAGNNYSSEKGITSPACIENAIPVGAVTSEDVIGFQRGDILDLVAPAYSIHSTIRNDGWNDKTGTSMSTPHVAGAAALIKQFVRLKNNTDISPSEIENILDSTGKEVDDTLNTGRNYSRIDVYAAIMAIDDDYSPLLPMEDPYPYYNITNCTELQNMNNNLSADYRLANDIDCSDTINWNSGEGFIPIGNNTEGYRFSGTLDGQGHKITGLYINRSSIDCQGLFGYIDSTAEITNVSLENVDITGHGDVGGLVGYNDYGTVINSYAMGDVTGSSYYVGGLVGYNNRGTISNSYATGNMTGSEYVGGLAGDNYRGTVINSYATGNVNGSIDVGGLVGYNDYGTVINSYATGNVTGSSYSVGGLVGSNNHGNVSNSYATGNVTGSSDVGGLVGDNYGGTFSNSYYNFNQTKINEENVITIGAIYEDDFNSWVGIREPFDASDYLNIDGDYYLIKNISDFKHLLKLGQNSSFNYKLEENLDLADEKDFFISYLAGEFDGNNKTIQNLNFNYSFVSSVGLFGYAGTGSEIKNIGLIDVDVTGSDYVGGLMGYNYYSTVSNSYAMGNVTGSDYVGGLMGDNDYGTVSNSYATGSVTGSSASSAVGGLVGHNNRGNLSNSYATGNVTGFLTVGGLVGHNNRGTVINSYATGNVTGSSYYVGGLMGDNDYGTVINSYATGSVTGSSDVGGLVGRNDDGNVSNSYALGNVYTGGGLGRYHGGFVGGNYQGIINNSYSKSYVESTNADSGGFVGYVDTGGSYSDTNNFWDNETSNKSTTAGNATGKTTAQMKSITTFNDTSTEGLDESWDIVLIRDYDNETWYIHDGTDYPKLGWGYINTIPTQPSLTTPANNSYLNSINMTWNESDDINGDTVYYYVLVNGTQACYTNNLNCSYNPSDGFYQWNVTPYDGFGNGTTSESFFYTYDTTPPSYLNFGKNNSFVEVNDTILFYASWQDSIAGLSHYIFSWNNSGTMENDTAQPLTLWCNITRKVNATNNSIILWNIYVNDSLGNWESIGTQIFKIGNHQPQKPSITNPSNNYYTNTDVSINWTSSTDDDSDTVNYYVMFNETQACYTQDINCSYLPLSNGNYEVYVVPNDGHENGTASDSIFVYYDTIKPIITSVSSSSVTSSGATLSVTTNENSTCRYLTSNQAYSSMDSTFTATGGTSHSSALSGLSASTSYTYYIRCIDSAGNAMNFSNFTSFTTSSSGGGSSGGSSSTGVSTPSLDYEERTLGTIAAGSTKSLIFYESEIYGITGFEVKAKERVTNARIKVEIGSLPSGASKPKGGVYKYIDITASNIDDDEIESAIIKFEVKKSWIESKKYDFNSVKLHRYNNKVWQELDTKRIGIGSDYYFYSAESPGFSTFAITAEKVSSTPTATTIVAEEKVADKKEDTEGKKPDKSDETKMEEESMIPKFNLPNISWLNWNWIIIGIAVLIIFIFVQAKWNIMHIKVGLESESILALGGKIESANQLIKDGKIKEAKKIYLSTLKIYNGLPEKEKKWVYKDINNLYKKINEKAIK
ncbi:MAG: GLUG motif-containing protein, partial [Candidatus Nanoarchaeia archaeon]|nr:GLUG motif-containing protein [Candidatus Nanoarchaeia archaeon]